MAIKYVRYSLKMQSDFRLDIFGSTHMREFLAQAIIEYFYTYDKEVIVKTFSFNFNLEPIYAYHI